MTSELLPKPSDRLLPLIFGLATLALVAICLWRNQHFFHDDAYITLRYAKHLATGDGVAWNLHEAPVEGFTSPLHVLLLSECLRLGLSAELSARAIGLVAHLFLTTLVWRRVRADAENCAAWLAVLLVGASVPMLVWDLGGLETPLFALVIFAAHDAAIDYFRASRASRLYAAGFLFGVGYAIRPDALVFFATTLAQALFITRVPTRQKIIDTAIAALAMAAVALPLTLWRILLFHAVFPNTYYAKVMGVPLGARLWLGLVYLARVLATPPFIFVFLPLMCTGTVSGRRGERAEGMLCINIAVYLVFVAMAGGDHMRAARFLVPIIPLGAVAFATLLSRAGLLRRYALPLMICCSGQLVVPYLNPRTMDPAALYGTVVGQYISKAWPAGSLIALNAAGSIPYFADDNRYIDMLGLNDVVIAQRKLSATDIEWRSVPLIGHLKGDGAYVVSRSPDFIIPGPAQGLILVPGLLAQFLGDRELSSSQAFRSAWQLCHVSVPVPSNLARQFVNDSAIEYLQFTFYAKRPSQVQGCNQSGTR